MRKKVPSKEITWSEWKWGCKRERKKDLRNEKEIVEIGSREWVSIKTTIWCLRDWPSSDKWDYKDFREAPLTLQTKISI